MPNYEVLTQELKNAWKRSEAAIKQLKQSTNKAKIEKLEAKEWPIFKAEVMAIKQNQQQTGDTALAARETARLCERLILKIQEVLKN